MEIIFLHHKLACRDCLHYDQSIVDFTGEYLEDYHDKTEYQVMNELIDFYKQTGKKCICGSDNLEPVNINLNGSYGMYDYDRSVKIAKENNLRFIQFNVTKSEFGVHLDIGCPEGKPDNKFLKQALIFVIDHITKASPNTFKSHHKGNMFISLLGKYNQLGDNYTFTIESFTYAGLLKREIHDSLDEPLCKTFFRT